MHHFKKILILNAFLLLVGCATAKQPLGTFSDTVLSSNTAKVSFSGNGLNPSQVVRNSLLYHCAQLTKQKGFDYFTIQSTKITQTGNIYGNYTQYQNYPNGAPMGYGYGQYENILAQKYRTTVFIQMFKGPAPISSNVYSVKSFGHSPAR